MSNEERGRALQILHVLKSHASEQGLRHFAGTDMIDQSRDLQVPYLALAGLRQYARCRAAALRYQYSGEEALARNEEVMAQAQTYFLQHI